MSNAGSDPSDSTETKRNLPSWMSSKEIGSNSRRKKQDDTCEEAMNHVKGSGTICSSNTTQNYMEFSKLLDGVVFVLSGFVNPERSTLRSQALEMGAEYRPDWTSDCTLLICAFPNTPKYRQVESDGGTIVSKEWISECYNQKKLVDIERFFMHAGKPWRKNSMKLESKQGQKIALPGEPQKQAEKKSHAKLSGSTVPERGLSNIVKDHFSPSKIKKWAIEDLSNTISWLESQEEKPEANEARAIAAEGIITCLQDMIESLKQNKDIRLVLEQWMFVPHIVKELAEAEVGKSKKGYLSKEDLVELAITCKKIYESEFDRLDSSKLNKKQRVNTGAEGNVKMQMSPDDTGFDSDETIEMTEEEIALACKQLSPDCEW